jgi:hypothetical protein
MARLKASAHQERRTAFAGTNLTPSERAEVERRAKMSGRRLSDFMRLVLLSDKPGAMPTPKLSGEVGRQIAVELARVGNNLNQLAHHANATGSMPDRVALDAVLEEIVKATWALIRL